MYVHALARYVYRRPGPISIHTQCTWSVPLFHIDLSLHRTQIVLVSFSRIQQRLLVLLSCSLYGSILPISVCTVDIYLRVYICDTSVYRSMQIGTFSMVSHPISFKLGCLNTDVDPRKSIQLSTFCLFLFEETTETGRARERERMYVNIHADSHFILSSLGTPSFSSLTPKSPNGRSSFASDSSLSLWWYR